MMQPLIHVQIFPIDKMKNDMRITMRKTFLIGIMLTAQLAFSQEKKVAADIARVMDAARKGEMALPDNMVYAEENIRFALESTLPYVRDTNTLVRNQSYQIIHKIGRNTQNTNETLRCVEALSRACHDIDPGIALYASRSLAKYQREFFSDKAKESIETALFPKSKTLPYVAQLTGYLGLAAGIERLHSIATDNTESLKNKWYTHLALARTGDKTSINYCLAVYISQETNEEVVEEMIPDLLYTRQKDIYDEVVKILYRDDKACLSGNPNIERRIHCGYRVMEQLGPYIDGFPLETHASGAIKGGDYDRALEKLRVWFGENKKYLIIDNSF